MCVKCDGMRKNDVKSVKIPFSAARFYVKKLCNFENYSINVKGAHNIDLSYNISSAPEEMPM